MKQSRFSETELVYTVHQAEAGGPRGGGRPEVRGEPQDHLRLAHEVRGPVGE